MISPGDGQTPIQLPQIATPYAHLILDRRDGGSHVVSIRHPSVVIGSAEGCRVRLRSDKIAPIHAVIFRDIHGLWIRRIDERGRLEVNKTTVNESAIQDGDNIRVGPIVLRLSTNIMPLAMSPILNSPEWMALHHRAGQLRQIGLTPSPGHVPPAAQDAVDDVASPESPSAMITRSIHHWELLADQVEQQRQQLCQIREAAMARGSPEHDRHDELQHAFEELTERHERIRNEISVLRLWLRPKGMPQPAERATRRPTRARPNQRVCFDDPRAGLTPDGTFRIIRHTCDKCNGEFFVARPMRWYELPLRLMFLRRMQCASCQHSSLHRISNVKPSHESMS